jgi:hypothetical protein
VCVCALAPLLGRYGPGEQAAPVPERGDRLLRTHCRLSANWAVISEADFPRRVSDDLSGWICDYPLPDVKQH